MYVFAVNTWARHSTIGAFPGEYDVFLDTNQDGDPDFVVFTAPLNGVADARELVFSLDLNDPDAEPQAFFFADSGTNDSNTIMPICGEQIGMDANDFFDPMDMSVGAFDNYFTGNLTDTIDGITVAPLGERYFADFGDDAFVSGDVLGFDYDPDARGGLRSRRDEPLGDRPAAGDQRQPGRDPRRLACEPRVREVAHPLRLNARAAPRPAIDRTGSGPVGLGPVFRPYVPSGRGVLAQADLARVGGAVVVLDPVDRDHDVVAGRDHLGVEHPHLRATQAAVRPLHGLCRDDGRRRDVDAGHVDGQLLLDGPEGRLRGPRR